MSRLRKARNQRTNRLPKARNQRMSRPPKARNRPTSRLILPPSRGCGLPESRRESAIFLPRLMTDLSPFWKSASHPQILMLARKRQRLRKEFSITSSASFFTNGCTTSSKQPACNPARDNHELTRMDTNYGFLCHSERSEESQFSFLNPTAAGIVRDVSLRST